MKLTKAKLVEIKAKNYPHLNWRELLAPKEGKSLDELITKEEQENLDKYFSCFADVGITALNHFALTPKCIGCDLELEKDGILSFLLSGDGNHTRLEWGLTHGEAYCVNCQWPYRVYHRDIPPINFLSFGFPYHPDEIQIKEE